MKREPFDINLMFPAVMNDDLVQLSAALQKAIEAEGSIKAVASKTKVSTSTISRLINNKTKRRPRKKTLRCLLKVINRYIPNNTILLYNSKDYYRFTTRTIKRLLLKE